MNDEIQGGQMKEKPMCVCVRVSMSKCWPWCELVCVFKGEALGDGE